MSEVGPRLQVINLKNQYYETRDLEDSDSDGDIHLDGGTDRHGNDELHGPRPILKNGRRKALELRERLMGAHRR